MQNMESEMCRKTLFSSVFVHEPLTYGTEGSSAESHEDSRTQASRNGDRPDHAPSLPLGNRLSVTVTRAQRLSQITRSAGTPPRLAQVYHDGPIRSSRTPSDVIACTTSRRRTPNHASPHDVIQLNARLPLRCSANCLAQAHHSLSPDGRGPIRWSR